MYTLYIMCDFQVSGMKVQEKKEICYIGGTSTIERNIETIIYCGKNKKQVHKENCDILHKIFFERETLTHLCLASHKRDIGKLKTHIKCCRMQHLIRVYTICI